MARKRGKGRKEANNEEEQASSTRSDGAMCGGSGRGEEKSRGGCVIMGFLCFGTDMGRAAGARGKREGRRIPGEKRQTTQRWDAG